MKKTCTKCHVEKNTSEFRKDKDKSDGLQTFCKVCARAHHRSNYSTKYAAKYSARNNKRRQDATMKLQEYKQQLACKVCGETEPVCLEFHHLDPATKDLAISQMMSYTWERIQEEIQKCVCLCSNCHRKVHIGKIILAT